MKVFFFLNLNQTIYQLALSVCTIAVLIFEGIVSHRYGDGGMCSDRQPSRLLFTLGFLSDA